MPTKTTRKTPTRKSNVARPKSKSALNSKFTFSRSQLAIVIGLILVIGGIIVWRVLAATSQTEVETWTASGGNTKTVADNTASGGSYVEFLSPSVSTTVTPTPTTGFPTPATTGWQHTGVTLTNYTGPSTITTPGTVIDSKLITSCIYISAPNVTIKRSKIACAGDYGIYQNANTSGLLVEDVEVTPGGGILDRAIDLGMSNGATLRRVYAHAMQRGVTVGNNVLVEQSYIGQNVNNTSAHTSAIGTSGGTYHVIIRGNTLRTELNTEASSSISVYPEAWAGGTNDDFLIDGNLLSSGGEYCVYLSENTNIRFTNNRFNTDNYPKCGNSGPVASWSPSWQGITNTWSNNTWYGGPNDGKIVNP